ncbi:MAG: AAA family ATPase [Halanaerobiales bacterium]
MNLIPDKPTIPKQRLEEYNILVFSEPGVGKTSFANQFDGAVSMMFETGTSGILSYDINLIERANESGKPVWELFKEAKKQLFSRDHNFKTIVIDTATKAYDYALSYWKKYELNGVHPSNTENMVGYSQLNSELQSEFNDLFSSKMGSVIVCHADYKSITELGGLKRDKLVPDTGGSFGKWLMGEVDIIVFYDKDVDGNRILKVEGTPEFNAKQRIPLEKNIPAGNSAEEAYNNFKEEFDKAIKKVNEKFGVTEEMIEQHYAEKEKKQEKINLLNEIKSIAKSKGLNPQENREILEDRYGYSSISNLSPEEAEDYIEYLKNDYIS